MGHGVPQEVGHWRFWVTFEESLASKILVDSDGHKGREPQSEIEPGDVSQRRGQAAPQSLAVVEERGNHASRQSHTEEVNGYRSGG